MKNKYPVNFLKNALLEIVLNSLQILVDNFHMETRYDASSIESKWREYWLSNKLFSSSIDHLKQKFSIVIPPPNVTGVLHMGHALNNTFQDIICRMKRMQGFNVCWIPGTDHGGIATQNVVEKTLPLGTTKESIGKEAFIEKVKQFKDEKRKIIIHQLQQLGCSCDWDREQFTLSDKLSLHVREAFERLQAENLIYKGTYMVNWCCHCKTALSDDEVEHEPQNTKMYYIRYMRANINYNDPSEVKSVVIATTRPETILADAAIAFNPADTRYNANWKFEVPLSLRHIPMVADEAAKLDFGTGLVKVTPAHDKTDYEIGQRHNLPVIDILAKDGTIQSIHVQDVNHKEDTCETVGCAAKYHGMDRNAARDAIVQDLKEQLEKIEDYANSVAVCYRCKTTLEPKISEQYFVRMDSFRKRALELVQNGEIEFTPDHHNRLFEEWMSKDVDWCISRQLWWGHPIPYSNDVLDTWFSSALWAYSVFENDEEYKYYGPTDVLMTGADILFFWVARMIMMTDYLKGQIPFKKVFLHGIVRDKDGVKMSKTLGNVIDPLEIISEYSADILRFTLAYHTPKKEDTRIEKKTFETGKTFCTKYWNSVRFILTSIYPDQYLKRYDQEDVHQHLNNFDLWILNQSNILITIVTKAIEKFNYQKAAQNLYSFVWNQFCNKYLEYSKLYIDSIGTQFTLLTVISVLNRLLHPFIPHLTEEINLLLLPFKTERELQETGREIQSWPIPITLSSFDKTHDFYFDSFGMIIQEIRNVRNKFDVHKTRTLDIVFEGASNNFVQYVLSGQLSLKKLAKVNTIGFESIIEGKTIPISISLEYTKFTMHILITDALNLEAKIEDINVRIAIESVKKYISTEAILDNNVSKKQRKHHDSCIKKCNEVLNDLEKQRQYYKNLSF